LKAGPFPCPALLLERNEEHLDPLPAPPALWSGNPKLPRRIDQSAVSADGAILVRALEGGEVEVFVAGRLAAHREFKHLITRLDFSPDGKTLMVGDREGFAELVDLDLKPLRPPFKKPSRGINDWLSAMALSPDGRRFAMHTHEGRTTLWDAADGAEIATYLGGGEALAFSGDGSRLAFPGHVVDSESGRVIAEIEVPSGSLALSHDGSLLAGGPSYGKDIEIRHVGSGANVASIPAKEWRVRRLAFVRGRLVARATAAYGTGPKHVHVWELIDFQPLGLLSPAEREAAKRRTEPAWRFVATLSSSQ
jgi:WD40 repeat protein